MAAALLGCAKAASGQSGAPVSAGASGDPIPTTPPDFEPSPTPGDAALGGITVDGWTYYLDESDAAAVNYGEDPPLRRKSADGAGDEALGIRGFNFDVIGGYLYLDSKYPVLDTDGTQAWYTTRISLGGFEQKRLEYGSMSARLVPEGAQKFYFTVAGDLAVYVSDAACESVNVLLITLPDQSELDRKLDANRDMLLDIDSVENGKITFVITFTTPEGIQMYKGTYTMSEADSSVEKVSGTYYDYKSLTSELD